MCHGMWSILIYMYQICNLFLLILALPYQILRYLHEDKKGTEQISNEYYRILL